MSNTRGFEWSEDDDRRRFLRAQHQPGCRQPSKLHAADRRFAKKEPTCGGSYRCEKCGRLVGWCNGAILSDDEDRNGWCDECWGRSEDAKACSVQQSKTKRPSAADRAAVGMNRSRREAPKRRR